MALYRAWQYSQERSIEWDKDTADEILWGEQMDDQQVVNKSAAMDRLDNDEELYNEVVEIYFDDTPVQLSKLKEALEGKVISEVIRISHSLKSASANIGAERMSNASLRAEKASKAGEMESLEALVLDMNNEFKELLKYFGR